MTKLEARCWLAMLSMIRVLLVQHTIAKVRAGSGYAVGDLNTCRELGMESTALEQDLRDYISKE